MRAHASQAILMFGAAQAAVAKAVMDCVEERTIPQEKANDMYIIVSVFIEWDAEDKKKIYDYNYEAVKLAIERAMANEPKVGARAHHMECKKDGLVGRYRRSLREIHGSWVSEIHPYP